MINPKHVAALLVSSRRALCVLDGVAAIRRPGDAIAELEQALALFDNNDQAEPTPAAPPATPPATVVIYLRKGCVHDVEITGGPADVELRDYDTEGSDCEDLPTDDQGREYFRSEWSNVKTR